MTIKTILTAAALTLAPLMATAQCMHSQQAMTCAEGTVYDAATNTCLTMSG